MNGVVNMKRNVADLLSLYGYWDYVCLFVATQQLKSKKWGEKDRDETLIIWVRHSSVGGVERRKGGMEAQIERERERENRSLAMRWDCSVLFWSIIIIISERKKKKKKCSNKTTMQMQMQIYLFYFNTYLKHFLSFTLYLPLQYSCLSFSKLPPFLFSSLSHPFSDFLSYFWTYVFSQYTYD